MTDVIGDNYVAIKGPSTRGIYPSSPPSSRTSHESENDSLRALELLEGPIAGGQSRYERYVFRREEKIMSLFGVTFASSVDDPILARVLNFNTTW